MAKKALLVILTALTILGLLAGCAAPAATTPEASTGSQATTEPSGSDAKTISILYMQHWAPGADEVIKNKAIEWGKTKNVEIQFDMIVEKDFEFKVANAVENKSGPDVVLMRTTAPILYQDALVDVSDIADEIIKRDGDFYPANKAEAYTGSVYVSLPLYSVVPVWFYRIDELEKAGVSFPETYDEYVDFAKKVNRPEDNVYAFGNSFSKTRDGILFTQAVLWAFGSQVTAEDGKTVTFNSPETLNGLNYIVSLYNEHKVMPPGITGWDDSSNNKAYLAGQLVTTQNGPSIYYQLKSKGDPLLEMTGLGKWPAGPAGTPSMMDTYGLGIMKYSENQDLAKDLLRYLYQPENLEAFYNAGMGFQNPTIEKYTTMDVFTSDPKLQTITELLATAHAPGWPGPVTRAVAEIEAQGILPDMVARVLVDDITPEESVAEATQRIEDIYAKYK